MKEYKLKINGNDYNVTVNDVDDTVAAVEVNGIPFNVEFEKPLKKATVVSKPSAPRAAAASAPAPQVKVNKPAAPAGGTTITSPLPGVILDLNCKEGEVVKKGQKLLILEAMKMENVIESTCDGTITSIKVNKGDSVLEGAPLVIIG